MDKSAIITLIKNKQLLTEAFTHRSFLNETKDKIPSNERLEFLGDAVLEILVSEYLFTRFPDFPEGKLTLLRSSIVRTETLARAAQAISLGTLLRLSRGEEEHGGRTNESILANTYESVVGALYLDQGLPIVKSFLEQTLFPYFEEIIQNKSYRDAKSQLQERIQEELKITPTYKVLTETGPDHQKRFTVGAFVGEKLIGQGIGRNKQIAESKAAEVALGALEKKL
jgi:ribonuclease III